MPKKIIFMGTPMFAVPILKSLYQNGFPINLVYTQPPQKSHRGQKINKSPVQGISETLNIEFRSPQNLKNNTEEYEFLKKMEADLAIVVAYGQIIPKEFLNLTKKGFINIHASILPKWRGAAPIQRAIMNLDTETGISIMKINEELDSGPISNIYKMSESTSLDMSYSYIADENGGKIIRVPRNQLGLNLGTQFNDKLYFNGIAKHNTDICDTINGTKCDVDLDAYTLVNLLAKYKLYENTNLKLDNGIVTNQFCETSIKDVYAAGDVSNFYHPFYERNMRLESYQHAQNHGICAGKNIAGVKTEYTSIPWMWSDQFNLNLQLTGICDDYDEIIERGNDINNGVIYFFLKNNKIRGACGVGIIGKVGRDIRITSKLSEKNTIVDKQILSDQNLKLNKLIQK